MRSLKFWYNEWQHSFTMLKYWQKRLDRQVSHNTARIEGIIDEYSVRCAHAFEQIMRELDR
jgi:hypothetical protein